MEVDKKRMEHAWSCIVPKYFNLCIENAQKRGDGLSIFKMLSKTERSGLGEKINCLYHFLSKGSILLSSHSIPHEILDRYDPTHHIIIKIEIPAIEGANTIITDTRIFEIEYPK